jgi:hypothetical protein
MKNRFVAPFITLGVAAGMALAVLAGPAVTANQATPAAGGAMHPAHIHAGMCPMPGDVVFPLEDVTAASDMGSMATPDMMMASPAADMMSGTPMADTVMALHSTTDVEASLDDILAADHAINVHLSHEAMSVYVACGDITGTPDGGELVIDLMEQNGSGVSGQATLTDNGDGTTTVVIELQQVDVNMQGTPMSTPQA